MTNYANVANGVETVLHKLASIFGEVRRQTGSRGVVEQGVAFGDLHSDTEIAADKLLGRACLDLIGECVPEIGEVVIEGDSQQHVAPNGDLLAFVDPLDGSLNFARCDEGLGLPQSTMITVYAKRSDPTFDDVVVCGLLDLRSGDALIAQKLGDAYRTVFVPGDPRFPRRLAKTRDIDSLDLGSEIVIAEFYYPDRAWLFNTFHGMKGWLRNPGSAAFEMGLVARGIAAAFLCPLQKQHEAPGGRALVLGAGGYVCDFSGGDIGSSPVDFKNQNDVILAANEAIARRLVELLAKGHAE